MKNSEKTIVVSYESIQNDLGIEQLFQTIRKFHGVNGQLRFLLLAIVQIGNRKSLDRKWFLIYHPLFDQLYTTPNLAQEPKVIPFMSSQRAATHFSSLLKIESISYERKKINDALFLF